MKSLRDITVDASVPRSATLAETARAIAATGAPVVAVVEDGEVVGLVTADDVIRGLFPGYLQELEHTAFLTEDALIDRLESSEPSAKHMRDPVTVEIDSGAAHVAERFLHFDAGGLAVVDQKRYVGVVSEADFIRAVLSPLVATE